MFSHLHTHSEFSTLDALCKVKELAQRAKELGFSALAITDHGNIDGTIKFQQACEAEGIIPIIGTELYITPNALIKEKGTPSGHITIWVCNETGWQNLLKILTYANITGFYYKPRIDFDTLLNNCKELVFGTACIGSFINLPNGEDFLYDLQERTEGKVFLEIMPHDMPDQKEHNQHILDIYTEGYIDIVATNDLHYIEEDHYKTQEILLAIQRKAKWNDPDRWKFDYTGLHLRTADEMIEAFEQQGIVKREIVIQALKNTQKIVKLCKDFRIAKKSISLPKVPGIPNDETKYFWELLFKGMEEKIPKDDLELHKKYSDRLSYEATTIIKKGFVRYMLMVYDLMNWCREQEIMCGTRGSVGSSLVAYLLNITNLDPIKYDLPFSRFINEERADFPDADIDVEDTKRHLVKQRLQDIYGVNNTAEISTFLRMKSRMAVRDVCRVFDVPIEDVDPFAKSIGDKEKIQDALEKSEGKIFKEKYPELVEQAINLEGTVRSGGIHAAGVIISNENLKLGTRCNLKHGKNDNLAVNWEKEDAEYSGLIKLDILGLNCLSILGEIKRLIKENHNTDVDFVKLPLDNPKIFEEISKGNTIGVFQMGTPAMRKLIKEMGVENFLLISDAVALVRPGPHDSGMTADFIKRKHGESWEPKHPLYEEVAKRTFGICAYQEQIMNIIHKVAGLPFSVADKIRKIIGKKRDESEFDQYKEMFKEGCRKQKTLNDQEAEEFWLTLHAHALYSFNLAHSAAYAMLGYWTMWAKIYYPEEFVAASLSCGSDTHKVDMAKEAMRLGLEIIPPKVGISDAFKWIVKNKKIYTPFIEIKGIGEKSAQQASEGGPKPKANKKIYVKAQKKIEPKGKIMLLLDAIKAFDVDEPLPTEALKYFDFNCFGSKEQMYPRLFELFDDDIYDMQDLLTGHVKHSLARIVRFTQRQKGIWHSILPGIAKCRNCDLHKERKRAVPPSLGKYNIMILGEAPWKDETQAGMGFVGKAGQVLWKELKIHGLSRELFYVSNACHCQPSQSKTPSKEHLEICKQWLLQEIGLVKPIIILICGNSALYSITSQEGGITKLNGTTEWNEELGCWLHFSVHPSSVNRNEKNKSLFRDAIEGFSKLIENVGGI